MANYGYNTDKNRWLASQTGYTGDFGSGGFGDWAQNQGLDVGTLEQMYSNQPVPQQQQEQPQQYMGPSASEVAQTTYGVMDPRFSGLEQGQQYLGQGQQALGTGQEAIMQNQATLQGDIGTVGTGVANVQNTLGTPTQEGQTVFGALQGYGDQMSALGGQFDQFGNQLGEFQGLYNQRSQQTLGNLNDVREQGLSERGDISRQLQDIQPLAYQTQQGVQQMLGSPMMQSPMQPSLQQATTPQATQTTTQGLTDVASTTNMGPMGPVMLDPRDMV